MSIKINYHKTPIGEVIVGSFDGKLCICDFRYRRMRQALNLKIQTSLNVEFIEKENDTIAQTKQQLDEYFNKERQNFTTPLLLIGTDFQKKVYEELQKIPYGETISYKELAEKIGQPNSFRAVANANGQNSLAIITPCHRVINSNGELGGYGGGVAVKKKLLELESGNN